MQREGVGFAKRARKRRTQLRLPTPIHTNTQTSRYAESVLKNITITVSEETARWARRRASDENTSVSKLVGGMLEEQMRITSAEYWKTFEKSKRLKPMPGLASGPLSREETHDRRR